MRQVSADACMLLGWDLGGERVAAGGGGKGEGKDRTEGWGAFGLLIVCNPIQAYCITIYRKHCNSAVVLLYVY